MCLIGGVGKGVWGELGEIWTLQRREGGLCRERHVESKGIKGWGWRRSPLGDLWEGLVLSSETGDLMALA